MGFTFKIGELTRHEYDGKPYYDAADVTLDNAPADGSPTDYTNARWPSYTGWTDFTRATGLFLLFGDKVGELIPEHPGYAILTKRHQVIINSAYNTRSTLAKEHIGRLEWLKFWVDWALANCKQPAFVNS